MNIKKRIIYELAAFVLCMTVFFQMIVRNVYAMQPEMMQDDALSLQMQLNDALALQPENALEVQALQQEIVSENAIEECEIIDDIVAEELTDPDITYEIINDGDDLIEVYEQSNEEIQNNDGSYETNSNGHMTRVVYKTTSGKSAVNGYFLPNDRIKVDFSDYYPLMDYIFILAEKELRSSSYTAKDVATTTLGGRKLFVNTPYEDTASFFSKYKYLNIILKNGSTYSYCGTYDAVCLVDSEPPTLSVTSGQKTEDADDPLSCYRYRLLTANVNDSQCGVSDNCISFSYDYNADNWGSDRSFVARENGTVYVKVKDRLDNTKTESVEIAGLDITPPEINNIKVQILDSKNGYCKKAKLVIDATDEGSGIDDEGYGAVCGGEVSECIYGDDSTIELTQNGIWTIAVRDKAGNIAAARVNIECVDVDPPSLVITGNPTTKVNDDVELSLTMSDSLSGLDCLYVQDDEVSYKSVLGNYSGKKSATGKVRITQNGSYTFTLVDCLGNSVEKSIEVTKIERTVKKKSSSSSSSKKSGSSSSDIKLPSSKKAIVSGGTQDPNAPSSIGSGEVIIKDGSTTSEKIEYIYEDGNDEDKGSEDEDSRAFKMYQDGSFDPEYELLSDDEIIIDESMSDTSFYGMGEETLEGELDKNGAMTRQTVSINNLSSDKEESKVSPIKIIIFGFLIILLLLIILAFILIKFGIISVPAVMEKIRAFKTSLEDNEDEEEEDDI